MGRGDKWLIEQAPNVPSIISYRLRALKTLFILIFVKLWKKRRKKDKFCKTLWKKWYLWNIRHMVDELFVSVTQRPSVLYGMLANFLGLLKNQATAGGWQNCDVRCYDKMVHFFYISYVRSYDFLNQRVSTATWMQVIL